MKLRYSYLIALACVCPLLTFAAPRQKQEDIPVEKKEESVPTQSQTVATANNKGTARPSSQLQQNDSNSKDDELAATQTFVPMMDDASIVPPTLVTEFPLGQRATIYALGGNVRGFGLLARYAKAGPREFVVARQTVVKDKEPFTPIAAARVFDPDGKIVAAIEFTDLQGAMNVQTIKIPNGKAGIWSVSFAGGRNGDIVEIRAKATPIWGVRGEKTLGVTTTSPRPAYLWVPPSSKKLLVGIESGSTSGISLQSADGTMELATVQDDPTKRVGRLLMESAPANTVCRVVLPAGFDGGITIAGAPSVLCPSEAAAKILRGGTKESHGIVVGGPLQARMRDWMVRHCKFEPAPQITFPDQVPAGANPAIDVLGFGKYGTLNSIGKVYERQNLDPQSPIFGGFLEIKPEQVAEPTWINFLPNGAFPSIFENASIGAAVAFKSAVNPIYKNKELIDRAALAAFSSMVTMQADNHLAENNLIGGRYPVTHAFFAYEALAQGYVTLKDMLDPEAAEIWKDAILAIGDKIADHQAYESNQWSHVMRGHLDVYLATGEKRFRSYFERLITSYLDNTFGPNSKMGQHPTGYYLEEFGPDGNYDKLNQYCVAADYLDYRELPDADPVIVEKLRRGVEKDLIFSSYFWFVQPDGGFYCPNGFNCRTMAMLATSGGYPGDYLCKALIPLAATKYALTPLPDRGIGGAGTMTHMANTPEWINDTLNKLMAEGAYKYDGPSGNWIPSLVKGYSLSPKVSPAKVPCEEESGTWELPGLVAWKRGALYGVLFYDVIGATDKLNGYLGGGPTALWTKGTGSIISSMRSEKPHKELPSELKHIVNSCVYGKTDKGDLFVTGRERSELKTIEKGAKYEIVSKLKNPDATLKWTYDISDSKVEISVHVKGDKPIKEMYLNLPLVSRLKNAKIAFEDKSTVVLNMEKGSAQIKITGGPGATLEMSALPEIQRLVIPLKDSATCTVHITATNK